LQAALQVEAQSGGSIAAGIADANTVGHADVACEDGQEKDAD
jgi:hypothetical protein